MAEEAMTFSDRVRSLLLVEDDARWKTIRWAVLTAGTAGVINTFAFNSSVEDSIAVMTTLVVLVTALRIAWLCSIKPISPQVAVSMESPLFSRRGLLRQGALAVIGILVGASILRYQAWALDTKLERALSADDYVTAAGIFDRAIAANVRLDQSVLKSATKRFLAASDKPEAWNAALASLNYKTSSDSRLIATVAEEAPHVATHYHFAGPKPGVGRVSGVVPAAQAARLDFIGHDANAGKPYGFKTLNVDGADLFLDGLDIRNVTISNSTVRYCGGALQMRNVAFLNCSFNLAPSPSAMSLTKAILTSNPIGEFSATGAQRDTSCSPPLPNYD